MAENNAVVGFHNPHAEAEAIIKKLQRSGFDMNKLNCLSWAKTVTLNKVSSAPLLQRRAAA
jgi:hypothetical protein